MPRLLKTHSKRPGQDGPERALKASDAQGHAMLHGKHYRHDGRGFRPTGNGTKTPCPHCGKSISHGLPGNPYTRRVQPCQVKAGAGTRPLAAPSATRTPRLAPAPSTQEAR